MASIGFDTVSNAPDWLTAEHSTGVSNLIFWKFSIKFYYVVNFTLNFHSRLLLWLQNTTVELLLEQTHEQQLGKVIVSFAFIQVLGFHSIFVILRSYIANRVTDKLTRVTDYIYCCRSGSAADTQAIADIVNYHLEFQR